MTLRFELGVGALRVGFSFSEALGTAVTALVDEPRLNDESGAPRNGAGLWLIFKRAFSH